MPMQFIDEMTELIRRPVPCRRRVITRHLVAPGGAERMLGNREELDVSESHVGDIARKLIGKFEVGERAGHATLITLSPPRSQMTFIDRERRTELITLML